MVDTPVSWCPLPWNHLSIKTNGMLRLCCHANTHESRGLILKDDGTPLTVHDDFGEAINNEMLKTVRSDMLNGKWPKVCGRCKKESESGMDSRNKYEQDRNGISFEECKNRTSNDGSIVPKIENLDIRLGNKCNLKCMMCNPAESDKWYSDHYALYGSKITDIKFSTNLVEKDNKVYLENDAFSWYDEPKILAKLKENVSSLKRMYIAGGEPLIIDSHYALLEYCIEQDIAKNITIEYNVNGTVVPQKVFDLWKHFQKIVVGVSVDCYGHVNDFIRYPSKWSVIEKNLELLDNNTHNITVHLTTALGIINYEHFADFLIYLYQKDFKIINNWPNLRNLTSVHPIHRPLMLNINILTETEVKLIHDLGVAKILDVIPEKDQKMLLKHLDRYKTFSSKLSMSEEERSKERNKSITYLDKLDILRNTNWRRVSPILASFFQ